MSKRNSQSHDKNVYNILSSMEKQEYQFRCFLASLKKCPNKYQIIRQNPQENNHQYKNKVNFLPEANTSYLKHASFCISQQAQSYEYEQKPQKNTKVDFRINLVKLGAKEKKVNKQIEYSIFNSSKKKLSQTKQLIRENHKKQQLNKNLNTLSQRYGSSQRDTSKRKLVQLGFNQQQKLQYSEKNEMDSVNQQKFQKNQRKRQNLGVNNFKLQQMRSISWNPNSQSFLKDFHNHIKTTNQTQTKTFLVQILNIEVSRTFKFLKRYAETISNFNQIQGKTIYRLFLQLFQTHQFKDLKQPLVKKYTNCLFYGQKPNLNSMHAGIILYSNGNAYFGSLRNFQKHGFGIELVSSQNLTDKAYNFPCNNSLKDDYIIFKGNFNKNSKSGQFLINARHYVYHGALVKGLFQGSGTLITPNSQFKGIWSLNKKISGIQVFKTKSMVYEGEYFEEKFHGKGKLKKPEQFYEGQFKNGRKNGKGILVNRQIIYEGSFKNDKKNGKGIIFDKAQYKKKNTLSQNQLIAFQKIIYKVYYDHDELVQKQELKSKNPEDQESLRTLQDQKSVHDRLTINLENIRPSKMLSSFAKEELPQYRKNMNSYANSEVKNIKQEFFSIFPAEPEEQQLYSNKGSYLQGNKFKRSPIKSRKEFD